MLNSKEISNLLQEQGELTSNIFSVGIDLNDAIRNKQINKELKGLGYGNKKTGLIS